MEGAQDCLFGGVPEGAMVDGLHQHRHPEDIGEQDEFLADLRAGPSGAGEERDALIPFFLGELDVFDEVVQMLDQGGHDLA